MAAEMLQSAAGIMSSGVGRRRFAALSMERCWLKVAPAVRGSAPM